MTLEPTPAVAMFPYKHLHAILLRYQSFTKLTATAQQEASYIK